MKLFENIVTFLKKLCLHPIFAMGVSCFPIIIGVVPAIDALKKYQSEVIIGLIVSYSMGFILQQYFQNQFRDSIDKNLSNKMNDVEKLVKTMPPEAFMEEFSRVCDECHKMYINTQNSKDSPQMIEENIRLVLSSIIKLVHLYDKGSNNARYGINIMMFEDAYKSENNIKKEEVLFTETHDDINAYKGLLKFYNKLSVMLQYGNQQLDTNTIPCIDTDFSDKTLLIPVPQQSKSDNGKYLSLPGAPTVFLTRSVDVFPDTMKLTDWINKYADFTETITKKVQNHFDNNTNNHVKSFVSIPLYKNDAEPVIAILNIHRNTPNLVYDEYGLKVKYLDDIMNPIYNILIEMLIIYKQNQANMVQ